MTTHVNAHVISVEREFTEAELAERGKEQAHLLAEIDQLEANKKQAADDFKVRIGELQSRVDGITLAINRGFERVDVECDVLLNTPVPGRKTYVDLEKGREVKVEDMTPEEQQGRLFEPDARPEEPRDEPYPD